MDSFCCRCGTPVPRGALLPPLRPSVPSAGACREQRCGERAWTGRELRKRGWRCWRYWLAAALAVVIVFGAGVLLWQNTARCAVSGCAGRAEYGRYCSAHVCLSAGCTNCRTNGKYCAIHRSVDPASLPAQIEISNVRITERGSYTVATGTVTNVGVIPMSS